MVASVLQSSVPTNESGGVVETGSLIAKSCTSFSTPDDLEAGDVVSAWLDGGVEIFRDEYGQHYASIPVDLPGVHRENWPLSVKSANCRRRLRSFVQRREGWTLKASTLREAFEVIETFADGNASDISLSNRISQEPDGIWIDMADPLWRTVHVSAAGWAIEDSEVPRFRRHGHQASLPDPVRGGRLDELFELIPTKDEADRLLILSWLVSALIPSVTTPILIHVGQPGGAKTTRSHLLRNLIDPSSTGILGETERSHLLQVMFHHAIPCFDNLGKFDRRDADFFCRAVTGTGFEKRRLYTDMDEVLIRFKRSIILNSIELPTHRSDFVDRCLIFQVDRVIDFKPRNTIDARFKAAAPRLFGALLDLVSGVLRELPTVEVPCEFRMADFAHVGRAVARSLKLHESDFDVAYRSTLQGQASETIDDDPFALAIIRLVRDEAFEGTARELLVKLAKVTKPAVIAKSKTWPGSPRWTATRLMELAPVLLMSGIHVEHMPRRNNRRGIRIACRKNL